MPDIVYALLIGMFAGSFFTMLGVTFYMVAKQPVVKDSEIFVEDFHIDERV